VDAFVPKKILIVEDSILNAQITADILNKYGYKTEIARTGEEAAEKARSGQCPDLILMDIELGKGMDGIEAARIIQSIRDIPIVFLTANANKEILEKIRSVTAYGYVIKSTDKYALLSALEMAIARWQTEKELELYRSIVENSLNEIYIFHPESLKFIAVNRGARENLGYTVEELSGMTPLDLKPEMDLQSFRELLAPLASGEKEQILFHTVHRRKDGTLYPVEIHVQLVEHGGEKVYVALVMDLTERRAIEHELWERERILSAIMDSAHDAIVMLDGQGKVVFWNPAAEQLFGYSREEVLGQELHRLLLQNEEIYKVYKKAFTQFQLTGQGSVVGKTIELKGRRKDGREIHVELSLSALKIKEAWHAVGILRDIGERKKTEEQLYQLSITDPLTNVYNRRFFMQMLKQEIERAQRTGRSFSVIMLDLDHFKSVNDRFGHAAGDLVLKTIADAVDRRIRKTDILARWGGEEFIILLPETPVDSAANLAEELRANLSSLIMPEVGHVTASFGVAGYVPSDTVDTIVMRADHMLYEAKAAGRNCVRYANDTDGKKATSL
jgi:diguanylate cyclase (GGDEF)-like protein/PAS domain S-box-containing protein